MWKVPLRKAGGDKATQENAKIGAREKPYKV
jgi:hypothetical protein